MVKMQVLIVLIVLIGLSVATALGGGGPGSWVSVDDWGERALHAAKFGVFTKYGKQAKIRKVVSVKQQVVRGINYEIVVEVDYEASFRDKSCTVDKFVVWDDLGDYKLVSHKYLDDQDCSEE